LLDSLNSPCGTIKDHRLLLHAKKEFIGSSLMILRSLIQLKFRLYTVSLIIMQETSKKFSVKLISYGSKNSEFQTKLVALAAVGGDYYL